MRLTGTTTPGQSEPGSNGNEFPILRALELEPHNQMVLIVTPRTNFVMIYYFVVSL